MRGGQPRAQRAISDLRAADLQAADEHTRVSSANGPADGAGTRPTSYPLGGGGTVKALSLPQDLAPCGGGGAVQAREAGNRGADVHFLLFRAATEQTLEERSMVRRARRGGESRRGGAVEEGGGRRSCSITDLLRGAAGILPPPEFGYCFPAQGRDGASPAGGMLSPECCLHFPVEYFFSFLTLGPGKAPLPETLLPLQLLGLRLHLLETAIRDWWV